MVGHLGVSVEHPTSHSSHALSVHEFKHHIELTAVSADRAHFSTSVSFSLCLYLACILSKINKTFLKNKIPQMVIIISNLYNC